MMIAKITKEGIGFECDNWTGICVLPAVAKIMAKISLERMKEHLNTIRGV